MLERLRRHIGLMMLIARSEASTAIALHARATRPVLIPFHTVSPAASNASSTMKATPNPNPMQAACGRYGLPAVKAAKIEKRVGFHTFRHTYTTLLTQNNEDVKVVQELLRHANSRITLDLYAQAGMQEKRLAQSKLVDRVLRRDKALA